ncbi:MAG: NUDIX hydrolase [Spirochaetia bacterium]|jgi:ADP-ribose pyrophosphatase YjhB (NUDIX family)
MNIRGVEIEPVCVAPEDAGAEFVFLGTTGALTQGADEHSLRAAYAKGIAAAMDRHAASIALPVMGILSGLTPVMAGKIMVQEAIRVARAGGAGLKKISLCCPDRDAWDAFSHAVNGYLKHLLDVLIWGPFVTVDAIIEIPSGIVLVKRSNPPLGFALPGGFVDYGESLEEAVRREAREETELDLLEPRQFHTYSDPSRDPRFHTITTVFSARAVGEPRAGDDAADVRVVRLEEIDKLVFAFDHKQVLVEWRDRQFT